MTQMLQRCPTCGGPLQGVAGWPPWCSACDWGVDPLAKDVRPPNRFDRWWQRRSTRISAAEFERLHKSGIDEGATVGGALAVTLATAVHAISALLIVAFVFLLRSSWAGWLKVVLGLILGLVLWLVAPRPRRKRPAGFALTSTSAPNLYGLVADAARMLGVRAPDSIIIDASVSSVLRTTWWRRRTLVIGMPLWAMLDAQGKVFILGEELAHERVGDLEQSWYVGSAVRSLVAWRYLFAPAIDDPWTQHFASRGPQVPNWVVQGLLVLITAPVRWLLLVLHLVFSSLVIRSGNRAEYVADKLGSRLSGRSAAIRVKRAVIRADSLSLALTVALRRDPHADLWEATRSYQASVPDSEEARLTRRAEIALKPMRSTRPWAAQRLAMLALAPDLTAELVLDSSRERLIDNEIHTADDWVRTWIHDHQD